MFFDKRKQVWRLFPSAIAAASFLFLGCGDDASADAAAWKGRWEGQISCVLAGSDFVAEFDGDGHYLYKAGDKQVPQTREGQITEWEGEAGSGKVELKQFKDEGKRRVYRFEGSTSRKEGEIHRTKTSSDEYEFQIDGSTMRVVWKSEYEEKEIAKNESGEEDVVGRSSSSVTCQGDLTRK